MAHQTTRHDGSGSVIHRRAEVSIILDGGDDEVYTTHDTISGLVLIEHESDAILTEVSLTLEGASATLVGNALNTGHASGRSKGRHHFLKLQHPVDDLLLSGRAIEAGRIQIQIPFTFVVPESILPGACSHEISHESVKAAHLLLPPTLEDDHYAEGVQVARISYAIRVRSRMKIVSTGLFQNESRSLGIRITPAREEQAPLDLHDNQYGYCLRRSLPIRSTFRKVRGEFGAATTQPPCLRLAAQNVQVESISTTLSLSFVPKAEDEPPPQISSIVTKLLEYTFCGAAPFEELPQPNKAYETMMFHRSYVEDFTLSARKLSNLQWTMHVGDVSTLLNDTQSGSASAVSKIDKKYYTASILVPIMIPEPQESKRPKNFPPSFNSCLVSRIHAIDYAIHIKAHSPIVLTTPIQIVAKESHQVPTSQTMPAATHAHIDRVLSYEGEDNAPEYEEISTMPTPQSSQNTRRPSRADELPKYAADTNLTTGQMQRVVANRHSISTTYEIPGEEWQNIWTGAKWVFGKAKAFHQRRSSRS